MRRGGRQACDHHEHLIAAAPVLRAVACSDKFRGTLSALEATAAMARGLGRAGFTDIIEIPLADGGEGTLDALLDARGGVRRQARVIGPLGEPVDAEYGVLPDGTAVIEMARASGLALLDGPNDALAATTRGTGELIAAAVRSGARRIVVGVGGSATTDGGLAAVTTLGWSLAGLDVVVACDVRTGFTAAAEVFGPNKGATRAQVKLLTGRLETLADAYLRRTGVDVRTLDGAGAAGGLAGGLAALGARLEPGFEVVATAAGLEEALEGATLVVTGEGRFDTTSLDGKVVGGVLTWAADLKVPHRAVVAGQVAAEVRAMLDPTVAVYALTDRVWNTDEAYERALLLVEEAALEAGARALADLATDGPPT